MRAATVMRLTAITLVLLVLAGCKTQKKKGELSPLGKVYHNVTAEYNGYFNADVLLMESRQQLNDQHQDNYTKLLPLYKYRAADNPRAVAESLDRAIEKVSIVVALHRGSDWDDDCYLLMGEAQYLKQDFESAEETLEYLIEEYNPRTMAKKKKKRKKSRSKASKEKDKRPKSLKKAKRQQRREKLRAQKQRKKNRKKKKRGKSTSSRSIEKEDTPETPDPEEEEPEEITPGETKISLDDYEPELEEESDPPSYFLKHRPAYQEGVLWLARTYIERGKYQEAQKLIYQLQNSPTTFKDVRRNLAAVEAYFFLTQEKYELAIEPLEKAIELERDRQLKARYAFIQAQIHERLGRRQAAYAAYEKVLAYRPIYLMEFRTRLNLTLSAHLTGIATAAETRKDLEKMLKDEKNIEYQDQIYFALAELDLEEGDKVAAMANLRKSLNAGQENTAQRTEAYLLLADLFFESEDFVQAKLYYDSTLNVMPETDDRYVRVSGLANNLTEIAESLQTIELQDSLLRIAAMSEEEKKALAFEIKKKQDEEARQALLRQQQGGEKFGMGRPIAGGGIPQAGAGNSDFFAYDDRALKRGSRDFQNRWGDRPLEDDWRRSNKSGGGFIAEELPPEERPSSVLTEDDISSILADVPSTQKEIEAAEKAMEEAYFTLGRLYRDRLENNEKSIDALETLLDRFPKTEYKLDAYYYLYLAHTDLNELDKAQRYYDKIVNGFPGSTYANILIDPQFLEKTADKEKQLNMYYDEVYQDFQQGNFRLAASKIDQVSEKFGANNTLQPRFELLAAMCLGNLEGKDQYVKALRTIIEKYPEAPEEKRAKEILRLLGEYVSTGPQGGPVNEEKADLFKFNPEQQHYIMAILQTEGGSPTQLPKAKARVSDFHLSYFKTERLRISNIFLGGQETKVPILVIRRFENSDAAMEYYETVQKNPKEFLDPQEFSYTLVAVSQDNYRQLLKNRSVEGYWPFFETYYLN